MAAIAASDGSTVEMIAGRNPDGVAALASEFSVPRHGVDLAALYADPDVDVIYVGLPNHVHHEAVLAAAAAGKPVLSEKSLTTTMRDAHALVDGVREHGTFFVEGLMYLAHPVIQRFVELVSDGRLGTIRSISGRYAADIWQVVNPEGRGTIYNLGCYPASLLHLVMQTAFGEDAFASRSIHGAGHRSRSDDTIADAALTIRFDNGVLASLCSSDSYGMTHDFLVEGDRGVLRFATNPWLPVAGENVITWQPFDAEATNETIVVHDEHDAFFHQVKMVERHVAAGAVEAARPSPRLTDSIEIMELLTDWEAECLASVPPR